MTFIGETKTENSNRIIILPYKIYNSLLAWKAYCVNQGIQVGHENYVFVETTREHLRPTTLSRRLHSIVESSGLEKEISVHSFRHSCVSYLVDSLMQSTDLSTNKIQRLLLEYIGHSEVEMIAYYTKKYLPKEENALTRLLHEIR